MPSRLHRTIRRFIGCLSFSLCIAGLTGAAPRALAQDDLSGYWVVKIPVGDGTTHDFYMNLKQNGDAVTGDLFLRGPDGMPLHGSFKDSKLHVEGTPPPPRPGANLRPAPFVDGIYANGKLLVEARFRQQPMKGTAERSTREAMLPPAPLPLPALHDVPDNGLARTPPMGWNSWNKFAGRITDADVRKMADAMVSSGMVKAGYVYINVDDTWELGRDANGNITSNTKFPDMKALADYVHSKGLKFGIYSSPGPLTCAGYVASFGHEAQDAKTFAAWGVDYLKYDWCSAGEIYKSTRENIQPSYQKMGDALQATGRPIVYSLCEYGDGDVWKWGSAVGGNLWRTTGDISDHWASMDKIGFSQVDISSYTRPGHWNDPDMLEIGNGGMTAEEYRTHMSLWSMLAAPLIAGNDIATMTDETKSILMNTEVIAIDQDTAAKPVELVSHEGTNEVLMRPLADGSVAVGLYNRGPQAAQISVRWDALKLHGGARTARDLWKHTAVPATGESYTATVPSHGVVLLKVSSGS